MKRGFTLVEIIVAITVVFAVVGIVVPVAVNARRSSQRTDSISNLRQIGQAIEIYRAGADGVLPYKNLDALIDAGLITNRAILFSKADDFKDGYAYVWSQCNEGDHPITNKTSYENLLFDKTFYDYVKYIDPGAAIVVDRTFGRQHEKATMTCDKIDLYYIGPILRMFEDTHVKLGTFSIAPEPDDINTSLRWSRVRLFVEDQTVETIIFPFPDLDPG